MHLNKQNLLTKLCWCVSATCLCIILCDCIGCTSWTNPTPDIIYSETVTFDEYGNQTSGIISVSDDKSGFIVTAHFISRYNAMIKKYGKKFTPELENNQGANKIDKTPYWYITNQSMGYFLTMNDLRRMELKANAKIKK